MIGPNKAIKSALDPFASVDYEGELAVIVGREGRVSADDDPCLRFLGYTIFNNVTSREAQKRHKQWVLGKGIDTFGYLSLASGAMRESALEKIAAVAESAATTRWREEPNTAKATSGSRTV